MDYSNFYRDKGVNCDKQQIGWPKDIYIELYLEIGIKTKQAKSMHEFYTDYRLTISETGIILKVPK